MKAVNLKHSKSKIDRAGLSLRELQDQKIDVALDILSNWRAYHASPLNGFATTLKERAKKISKNAIVAQRLKRMSSILLKLRIRKTMRLSTMQDIGGVRAIVDTVDEVHRLVHLYRTARTTHKLFAIDDYILNPKSDGYRSIHIVYQTKKEPSIFIEIQIRSYLQHIWATAVEVFGTLNNSSFKTGHGEKKWLELFSYLSSAFSLKEGSPVLKEHRSLSSKQVVAKLKRMIRDLNAIEQLNVYTTIYRITSTEVREKGRSGNYCLILLDSHKNTISLQTFSEDHVDQATTAYTAMEKQYYDDVNMNVVLVNTGNIKKLEVSYPNYFMDTKALVRCLSEIMIDKFF